MALATLSVDLVANLAKFETDLNRAARAAESVAQRVNRAFAGTGAVFAGNLLASAVTEAARQIAALLPSLIEGVAKFQDLEEKTGASAVALASFQTAADISGVSVDTLAGLINRLTGTLSKTNDESKGAGAALKAIGIDLESFRALAPEQQFQLLAQQLGKFEDGSAKTAVAIALLGKSGAEALPFLKALAEIGASQIKLTAEQIRLADDYADRQAKLRSELRQAAQVAALQLLPVLNSLASEMLKAAGFTDDLGAAADKLGSNTSIRRFAEGAALGLATVVEAAVGTVRAIRALAGSFEVVAQDARALAALATTSPGEIGDTFLRGKNTELRRILDERNRTLEEANRRYAELWTQSGTQMTDALRKSFDEARRGLTGERANAFTDPRSLLFGKSETKLPLSFVAPAADDEKRRLQEREQVRQAILQNALKVIGDLFGEERERHQFQRQFLDAQYDAGLISLRDYWNQRLEITRRAAESEAGEAESKAARLRAELPKITDPSERIRAEGEIAEAEAKAAQARRRYAEQSQLDTIAQARAIDDLAARTREFAAQMLELQGDAAGAARIRAEAAIEAARSSSRSLGLTAEQIGSFESATRANLALGDAQRELERISERAAIAEERFLIAARTRGLTTVEIEQGLHDLRSRALADLQALLRDTEALADAATPDSPTARFVEQLRLQLDRIAAGVNPALERMRELGNEAGRAIAGEFERAAFEGGKLRDIINNLGRDLARIAFRKTITEPLSDVLTKGINQSAGVTGGGTAGIAGIAGLFQSRGGAAPPAVSAAENAEIVKLFADTGDAASKAASALGTVTSASDQTTAGFTELSVSGIASAISALFGFTTATTAATAAQSTSAASSTASSGGSWLAKIAEWWGSSGKAEGGYTGGADVRQPVGVVHGQEYVFSAPAVRSIGVPALEQLHRSARAGAPRLGLAGYADGGFVRPLFIGRPAESARSERRMMGRSFEQHIHISAPAGGISRESEAQTLARIGTVTRRALERTS